LRHIYCTIYHALYADMKLRFTTSKESKEKKLKKNIKIKETKTNNEKQEIILMSAKEFNY